MICFLAWVTKVLILLFSGMKANMNSWVVVINVKSYFCLIASVRAVKFISEIAKLRAIFITIWFWNYMKCEVMLVEISFPCSKRLPALHTIRSIPTNLSSRQGDFSRLTVNVLSTNYSRTYSSYIGSDAALMTYPTNSMMYLGGLSPLEMVCYSVIFVLRPDITIS